MVESQLSKTEYKDWYNMGQENNKKFPIIDFQKGNNVVSLKTIDPILKSYAGNGATNKIMDVKISPGTKGLIDAKTLMKESNDMELIIKEYWEWMIR